jgi:hypothetical protein
MASFPPPPLSAGDYQAIEAAVMETARGRWFLAEYARRNRQADTAMLLAALTRLENVIRSETILLCTDTFRVGLTDMDLIVGPEPNAADANERDAPASETLLGANGDVAPATADATPQPRVFPALPAAPESDPSLRLPQSSDAAAGLAPADDDLLDEEPFDEPGGAEPHRDALASLRALSYVEKVALFS